jgi:putative transposase
VSLQGNTYQVDPLLVGRRVELVFDPFDLTTVQVRYQGRAMGIAVPHRIGRHVHPQARPDQPLAPAAPTGIDYLGLVAAKHRAELAARINYTDLPSSGPATQTRQTGLEAELASYAAHASQQRDAELPGQLDITDLTDLTDDDREGNR